MFKVTDIFVGDGVQNLILEGNGGAFVAYEFRLLLCEEADGFGRGKGQGGDGCGCCFACAGGDRCCWISW